VMPVVSRATARWDSPRALRNVSATQTETYGLTA
jgi:hypothetical protein